MAELDLSFSHCHLMHLVASGYSKTLLDFLDSLLSSGVLHTFGSTALLHLLILLYQNPKKKYNLEYYMDLVDKIVKIGTHIVGIKDMAGVLKPKAARLLVGSIRERYPDLPIHVHTHDSAGTGVASMQACAEAGADAVDAASDSLSGCTSQPSIGAILASLEGTDYDPGLNGHNVRALDQYWSQLRLLYSPFEAGLTGPDPGKSHNSLFPPSAVFSERLLTEFAF